jgi:uncharacterized secreted protein with C-terminal beta-propeller domain
MFFILALAGSGIFAYYAYQINPNPVSGGNLAKFATCNAIADTFREAQQNSQTYYMARGGGIMTLNSVAPSAAEGAAKDSASGQGAVAHSDTNVQVQGVDEADIVKTDGQYIYTITNGNRYVYYDYYGGGSGTNSTLVIAKAYPADEASIVSRVDLGDFYPQEMFIQDGKVLVFGSTSKQVPIEGAVPQTGAGSAGSPGLAAEKMIAPPYYPPYRYMQLATVRIYDASDKANPSLVRSIDLEGNYLSSRKIGSYVYFVVNSYPDYQILQKAIESPAPFGAAAEDILPSFRDRKAAEVTADTTFAPVAGCTDVAYFEPVDPQNFVTIASISMDDPQAEIAKEVILGSGQNVYASASNLYVAEMNYPYWTDSATVPQEQTIIHRFSLDNGKITQAGQMTAPGRILNQFSMDEYDSHFRIATTVSETWTPAGGTAVASSNNVYVFDGDSQMTGKIEGIAPGESIYAVRFMGARGYVVTFKKVDPLFVLDLSNPSNPAILGKLKIPGYSDYLHPYDENHIIGIGKEVDESIDADKVHSDNAVYFTAIQGVKIALFDVTDVANPKEMYKVVIGDRGTDSYALKDHKAFLFDKEKNLLVVPILLAEIPAAQKDPANRQWPVYGEFTFQGAYVYDLSLDNGFAFKGRITHYDDNTTFMKSGYYYYGDDYSVKRSLYIGDVLYTVSGMKIKLNSLSDLAELKQLELKA